MKHTTPLVRIAGTIAVAVVVVGLSGCATVTTLAEHHSLRVSTKMSSSIFLNPVAAADRTVFVQVHNTTDKGDIGLVQGLDAAIQAKGWRVVDDPAKAESVLQVNVLQAGEIKQNALQAALGAGYGGGVLGTGAVAAGAAALAGGNAVGIGGAGLAAGAADYVGSLLVKNVTFSVITDVRVLQKGADGQTFTVHHNTGINSGAGSRSGTSRSPAARVLGALLGGRGGQYASASAGSNVASSTGQSYTTQSQYMIHQTRVVTYANQANLEWKEALPKIKQGLVNSISGLF